MKRARFDIVGTSPICFSQNINLIPGLAMVSPARAAAPASPVARGATHHRRHQAEKGSPLTLAEASDVPEGMALVTVEVYITDMPEKSFIIAGEPEEASRCARRLAREFDVPPPSDGDTLQLYITKAECKRLVPVLERFPSLSYQDLAVAEKQRFSPGGPKGLQRPKAPQVDTMDLVVSPRLYEELHGQVDALANVVQTQLDTYDVGPNQKMVYRWPVKHRLGHEVMLAILIDMPKNRVCVGFEDDFDLAEIERNSVYLGATDSANPGTIDAVNSQMRQLRRAH